MNSLYRLALAVPRSHIWAMRQLSFWVGAALLMGAGSAAAQIQPLTTQELQQQNQSTIQNSTLAGQRDMTQTELGLIEQRQREQQLFSTVPGQPVPALPPGFYVMPPPPAPPPPPPPASKPAK